MPHTIHESHLLADCDLPGCHNSQLFFWNETVRDHGWIFAGEGTFCCEAHKGLGEAGAVLLNGRPKFLREVVA